MKDRKRYLKWGCTYCGSSHISDRWETHRVDYCSCEKSFVDAEEHYDRYSGNVKFIGEANDYQDLKEVL